MIKREMIEFDELGRHMVTEGFPIFLRREGSENASGRSYRRVLKIPELSACQVAACMQGLHKVLKIPEYD